jgi:hypothetical protein
VSRDEFVGGRPIGGRWLRMDENNLRRWRGENRPPAIAPYRESVLAGQTRQPPRDLERFRGGRQGDFFAGRVPFHAERRAIENNGGRPVGRTELQDRNRNPKEGRGDFRAVRQVGGDNERAAQRERAAQTRDRNTSRELNNDSVRDWQRRDRERGGASPRVGSGNSLSTPRNVERNADRDRQRLEIMQAEESRQEARDARRRDHMQRQPPSGSNSFQQGSSGSYRPPKDHSREASPREPSRGFIRSEPRQQSQPRSEPRRDYSPPPRAEPRSQPQPRPSVERSQPRSSPRGDGGGGGGNRGDRGGHRPGNSPRER